MNGGAGEKILQNCFLEGMRRELANGASKTDLIRRNYFLVP